MIRLGLEWLAAGGHISIIGEKDAIIVSAGNAGSDQYLQRELFMAIKGLLEETAAYRTYFAGADADSLMEIQVPR